MSDDNERFELIHDTISDVIEMLEDRFGPSDDELVVISAVISYILCHHVSSFSIAEVALKEINSSVMSAVRDANKSGDTMWVSGKGH